MAGERKKNNFKTVGSYFFTITKFVLSIPLYHNPVRLLSGNLTGFFVSS